jgi:hypothetical protein
MGRSARCAMPRLSSDENTRFGRGRAVFEPAYPVHAPLSVDDGLRALALGEGFGREIGKEFRGEALVGGEVFGREHDDACGQT